MSIATLNKYKKLLKQRLEFSLDNIKYLEKQLALTSAGILDDQDQIEDIDAALLILKKHIPVKGKK